MESGEQRTHIYIPFPQPSCPPPPAPTKITHGVKLTLVVVGSAAMSR